MSTLEKILAYIVGVSVAFAIIGGIALVLNFIPYLLWNKAVAPTFGWPQATFWQVFFIIWAASFAARLVFPCRRTD
jgi:hypothetical protein